MPRVKRNPRKMEKGLFRRPLKIINHLSLREKMIRKVQKMIKMTRKMPKITKRLK